MRIPRRYFYRSQSCVLLCSAATLLFGGGRPPAETAKAKVNENYGKLPMSFEENRGQTDSRVKFLSQGQGYTMFLTSKGVVLSLESLPSPSKARHAAVQMEFIGAKSPVVSGQDQQLAKTSYFVGNDPKKWVTGVPNYSRVRYSELYPGVDLMFYGNQRQLEYDFVIAPGVSPRSIQMKFAGINSMHLDGAGNLVLSTGSGDIRQHKPVLYQQNEGARQSVEGRYVLLSGNRVAFEVAKYDSRKPLVIDPVLTFSTYLGGPGEELFALSDAATRSTYPAVAVDFEGSVYLTGYNGGSAANFPGHPTTLGGGGSHVFVVKMNSTGTALLYSVVFGGGLTDVGGGIAVDGSGNAYVTGFTSSTNFPVTLGVSQTTLNGPTNAFVSEINAAGSALTYSTFLGGSGNDWGRAIGVDPSGNAYVTGTAQDNTFPLIGSIANSGAGFLTKVNSTGHFVYSTYLSAGIGYGIAVDTSGEAYVTGSTGSVTAPLPAQGYVLKVNSGGGLAYGPVLLGTAGGSMQTIGFGIAVDSLGNAFVTGMTNDPHFPQITGNAPQKNYGGGTTDAFAIKLNSSGSLPPLYGTYIGGVGTNLLPERGSGIGVDVDGYAYVAGTTQCIGFPSGASPIPGAHNGSPVALMKGTASGSSSTWTPTSLGGSFDQVNALAFDPSGTIYAGASAFNASGGGVFKSANGGSSWTVANSGITSSSIDAIAVNPSSASTVYAIGSGHIYQSTNSGSSWTTLSQTVGSAASIAIGKNNVIYVGSSTGLIYSTNAGSSWTSVAAVAAPVYSVIADPNNAAAAYAGNSTGVYQTTNGGAAWNPVNTGLPATHVTGMAITSTGTLYAATTNGLFYTLTSSISWTQAALPASAPGTPFRVAVDASNTVYVAFEGAGIAVGTNGGTSSGDWSGTTYAGLTNNQITALAVQPGVSGTAFAGIVAATDAFVTRIAPDGSQFLFSACMGGSDNDLGQNIAVSHTGTVFVSGATISTNLPVTPGAAQTSLAGLYDDFVARVDNTPFVDVATTDVGFYAINIMYELGITNGCLAVPLEFCPTTTITREQMAKFLVVAIEGSSSFSFNPNPYFTDVPTSNAFFGYIQKLYELGITNGCAAPPNPPAFCPSDGVTRGQMAAFIIRARFASIPFTYPSTPYFADVPANAQFFNYIQEMYQLGITNGCSTSPLNYCPDTLIPRDQMAVFVVRGLLNQLLPLSTPILTSIIPNSSPAGTPVTVTVTGFGTHFASGTSQVNTVSGVTASNVVVHSPTSLSVQLTGTSSATPNPSPIVVTTGSEQAGLPVGFIVK